MMRLSASWLLCALAACVLFTSESEAKSRETQIAVTLYNYGHEDTYYTAMCTAKFPKHLRGAFWRYQASIDLTGTDPQCHVKVVPMPSNLSDWKNLQKHSISFDSAYHTRVRPDGRGNIIVENTEDSPTYEEMKDEQIRLASVTDLTSSKRLPIYITVEDEFFGGGFSSEKGMFFVATPRGTIPTIFHNVYIETGIDDASCFIGLRPFDNFNVLDVNVEASTISPPELACDVLPEFKSAKKIKEILECDEWDFCSTRKGKTSPFVVRLRMNVNYEAKDLERVTVDGHDAQYVVKFDPPTPTTKLEKENEIETDKEGESDSEESGDTDEDKDDYYDELARVGVPTDSPILPYLTPTDVKQALHYLERNGRELPQFELHTIKLHIL